MKKLKTLSKKKCHPPKANPLKTNQRHLKAVFRFWKKGGGERSPKGENKDRVKGVDINPAPTRPPLLPKQQGGKNLLEVMKIEKGKKRKVSALSTFFEEKQQQKLTPQRSNPKQKK